MSPTSRRTMTAPDETREAPTLPPDPFAVSGLRIVRRPNVRAAAVAAVVAVLAGALTVALVLTQPARYYSQATLLIDNPTQLAAAADEGTIAKLSGLRAKYAALVDTPDIAKPVADQLRVPVGKVYASAHTFLGVQSLVLVSGATSGDPRFSQRVAEAVAEEISQYVQQEHVRFHIPLPQRFSISVVDKAYAGQKVAPTRRHAMVVGGVTAALVLVGLYVLLELVATRRSRG